MAYSKYLADQIRKRLQKSNITDKKKMMGGLIFMVNHKMCIGVDINKTTSKDRLMVKVGKAAHDDLFFKKGSINMDFTGKTIRGFLFITPDEFDAEANLDFGIKKRWTLIKN